MWRSHLNEILNDPHTPPRVLEEMQRTRRLLLGTETPDGHGVLDVCKANLDSHLKADLTACFVLLDCFERQNCLWEDFVHQELFEKALDVPAGVVQLDIEMTEAEKQTHLQRTAMHLKTVWAIVNFAEQRQMSLSVLRAEEIRQRLHSETPLALDAEALLQQLQLPEDPHVVQDSTP